MLSIAGATATLFEAVRDQSPDTRVWLASSGAIFGDAGESPQRESTPCRPTTPYAIAKLAAHQLAGAMRAHDGLYACSGIVFNHESERRPHQFVTRTITHAAAQIKLGLAEEVTLGSLDAVRDWSFAGDAMRGAWLMLQQDRARGLCVRQRRWADCRRSWRETAFACVGLQAERYVRMDPKLVRAPERTASVGDPTKARTQLGWEPEVSFEQLVATHGRGRPVRAAGLARTRLSLDLAIRRPPGLARTRLSTDLAIRRPVPAGLHRGWRLHCADDDRRHHRAWLCRAAACGGLRRGGLRCGRGGLRSAQGAAAARRESRTSRTFPQSGCGRCSDA